MSELRIDQELRRVSAALAEASPEAPSLTMATTRRSAWMRPAVVGFAAALAAGVVGVALFTSSDPSDPGPVAGGEQTRWEWIVAGSSATWTDDLLVARVDSFPWPRFGFVEIGEFHPIAPVSPILLEVPQYIIGDAFPPVVHVGRVAAEDEWGPLDIYLVRSRIVEGEVVICTATFRSGTGSAACHDGSEPADGMVSGSGAFSASDYEEVSFWVPRDAALIVVHMKDGSIHTQRPVAGVGAMLLDLDRSGIDYVEALNADGTVLLRDDFALRNPPLAQPTTTTITFGATTTEVAVTDPELHVSGASTRYFTTGEVLVEGFVDQPAQVTVGGMEAAEHVDPDGRTSFWAELALAPGDHEIQVIAITDAGGAAGATVRFVVDPDLEQWFGYFGGIDEGSLTMAVDTAEWLTGGAAVATARADGVIPADQDYIDGDYYIRNLVSDALIAPLGDDPVIVLQACWEDGPCVSEEQVDLATWLALLADPESGTETAGWWWYGGNTLPYWFTFQDGVVVQITEHYLP